MKEKESYGLILSSIVAVVALVGLVVLFSKASTTGALLTYPDECTASGGQWANMEIEGPDGRMQTALLCVSGQEAERPYATTGDTESNYR